jgi:hypothetical protein
VLTVGISVSSVHGPTAECNHGDIWVVELERDIKGKGMFCTEQPVVRY